MHLQSRGTHSCQVAIRDTSVICVSVTATLGPRFPGARRWAQDIVYSRATDRYYLTFTVTETGDKESVPRCRGDSAIGVATSKSPTGPWKVSDTPVVRPRPAGGNCSFYWTFDPDVLGDGIGSSSVLTTAATSAASSASG